MEHNDSSGIREEEFRYDACGNLFDSKPCPASQTEEYRNTQYRYDEFGRLSRKWNHSLEQRFEYDADSRLVKVENVRGTLYAQVEMEYDLLGRRTLKRAHHRWTNAVEETRFGWTGLRLYGEKQPDCPEVLFTYEEGSYAPLARVVGRGESTGVQWFRNGLNGNPEALTDGNGVLKWRQREPVLWGKTQYEDLTDGQGVMQNLRFQGQYLDRETGLHYNLFRYYDPECGRFTQPDPANLAGGINLYQYVPNPLSWVDPWGLACNPIHHLATNKHKTWSPRFRALFDKYGLGRFKNGNLRKDILDDPLNKVAVPGHKGPHSEPGFHQTIYDRLKNAADAGEANGGGIEGGRAALEKELETMRKEAVTPGTWLNDVLTKK
ncbi:hypothetical protein CDR68_21705 [Salmonella enterica]|nr:hypothetical protein [Salmonella enterica]